MSAQHASTKTRKRSHARDTRLRGRRLLLAQGLWLTLVILTLAIFGASLPLYLVQLQTPCTEIACEYQQLTHSQAETLKGMGLSLGAYAAFTLALALTSVMVSLVVSALIIWRRSDDRMALIVALMLVTLGPIIEVVNVPVSSPSPWQVPNECLGELAQALLVLVFLLFPCGRFVPRWTRLTLVVFLAVQVPFTFLPVAPSLSNTPEGQLGWLVAISELAIVAGVQLYRYQRVSNSRERQQTKWVIFGLAAPITVNVIVTALVLLFPLLAVRSFLSLLALNEVGFLLPLFLPLSFGVAMLRSRLWEIDVIIKRTLVYGALTVILTGIYVGLIIGLQTLLQGLISQDNSVAIVISTLVIAAIFQPLRKRLQTLIDRRFYRRKYDAAKIVAAFSTTLRQEVDLDQLHEQLVRAVLETLQPSHVSLWLRPPEPSRKEKGEPRWEPTPSP